MMVVQMLVIAAVTGWFVIKGYWNKVVEIFRGILRRNGKIRKPHKDTKE